MSDSQDFKDGDTTGCLTISHVVHLPAVGKVGRHVHSKPMKPLRYSDQPRRPVRSDRWRSLPYLIKHDAFGRRWSNLFHLAYKQVDILLNCGLFRFDGFGAERW